MYSLIAVYKLNTVMESPSTPKTQRTLHGGAQAYQPLRKIRLYELSERIDLGASECTGGAQTSDVSTPSTTHFLSHKADKASPTKEEKADGEYTAQRSTFIPPESPDSLSPAHHFKSLGNLSEVSYPTPFYLTCN